MNIIGKKVFFFLVWKEFLGLIRIVSYDTATFCELQAKPSVGYNIQHWIGTNNFQFIRNKTDRQTFGNFVVWAID